MINQSNRPPLPATLKKKRIRNILGRVIPCALLLAFLIVIIVFWGEKVFPFPRPAPRYVGYTLLMLVPFAITGVPHKLIDMSFSGTVIDMSVTEKIGTYSRSLAKPGLYTRHDLILTIQKDNGERIKYTALSLGVKNKSWQPVPNVGKIGDRTEDFSVGDRVHKYYGFKHLYVELKTEVDRKYCIVCGTKNDNKDMVCWSCHSELISPDN